MKIKNLFLLFFLVGVMGFANQQIWTQTFGTNSAMSAQCDKTRLSPIKCGYYEEGYIDGANDARNNRSNNHDRYDNKFENKYESFYRDGYNAGYSSVRTTYSNWNSSQKRVYDQGYNNGKSDRGRRISRLPARYEGRYNRSFEVFYRKGYNDGYDNKRKQYGTPINQNPNNRFPNRNNRRRGTATGNINWAGRVDNRANIIIQNGQIRTETVAGRVVRGTQTIQGVVPRRGGTFSVRKNDGRGNAFVLQQPNRSNNFTAIIQVFDSRGGADNYRLNISWQASINRQERYQSGKVIWRGRVDATTNIRISDDFVDSIDITGSGLSNVRYDLEGFLAARRGSVRVRKLDGRGTVSILEQPTQRNDYTAVIQIVDSEGGDDEYEIEITW